MEWKLELNIYLSLGKSAKYEVQKKIKALSPVQVIVYSFVLIILVGTLLLLLPISVKNTSEHSFFTALFTAVSCTCVTGLSLHDTWSYFSFFGQVVMLSLIQIGGLGLVSFTTGFTLAVHRRLGLRDIKIMREGTQGNLVDIPQIIKTVFISTLLFEILGAILLCLRLVPKYGLNGAWLSIFLAISSYCNAGFDVSGFIMPDSSLMAFSHDKFVLLIISSLIIIGGLGFLVVSDIYNYIIKKLWYKSSNLKLSLHTKVVLKYNLIILLIGTFLFFCFEYENTLSKLDIANKLTVCFFHSASCRTAGLYSFDLSKQYSITKFISILLMFIGASPASTGGGVKTVSFVVLLSVMGNTLCGKEEAVLEGKQINKTIVYRSLAIYTAFVVIITAGTLMLTMLEAQNPVTSVDIIYEVVSAISTTGLSTGITRILSNFSKCLLMLFMFIGRVGPISLLLAIIAKKNNNKYKTLPEGKLIIG